MKKYIPLICSALLVTTLQAKPQAVTFEKTYGTKNNDSASAVIQSDGGFLIVGKTEYDRHKRFDMYLLKIDNTGKKIWSKAIGGEDDDEGTALMATKDGYIAVGTTESFGGDRSSIYVVNLTKEGNPRWQKAFFSSDESYYHGTAIARTKNGHKVVGWEDKLEFFGAKINGYVADIDKDGERNRLRRYGGKDDDKLYDILKTDDGYVLVGESDSIGDNGFDAYVVKIDEKGATQWQKAYGWGYDEKANAIAPSKNGYIIAGTTKSNRDKREEAYVVKLDKNGKMIWQNTYGGRYDEEAFDIVADDDGYVIVGYTETKTHGRKDVYVFKIDEKGHILWQKNYGGRDDDIGYGVARCKDGYIIVGETQSYGNGRKDAYVIKIDKDGNRVKK